MRLYIEGPVNKYYIQTLCMKSIAKFINGDKSMDELDAFVESIKSMNIDGYLEIQQDAYDRAMEGSALCMKEPAANSGRLLFTASGPVGHLPLKGKA